MKKRLWGEEKKKNNIRVSCNKGVKKQLIFEKCEDFSHEKMAIL